MRFIVYSLFFLMPFAQTSEPAESFNAKKAIYSIFFATGVYALAKVVMQFSTSDKTIPRFKDLNIITFKPHEQQLYNGFIITDKKETDTILRKKNFKNPVLIKEGLLYKIEHGVPEGYDETITVISDGYPCHSRPLPLYAYNLIKKGVVSGTVIHFTYPTDHNRKMFSFCQEQDIMALDLVIKEIKNRNPKSNLVLYGMCKGGTTVLRYLAEKEAFREDTSYIKAAIIESPLLSIETGVAQYPLVHTMIRLTRPNYDPKGKTFLDDKKFPNIPVYIGHLPHDHMAKSKDVVRIHEHIQLLKAKAHKQLSATEMITIEDKSIQHCRMPESNEYVQKVNEFVK